MPRYVPRKGDTYFYTHTDWGVVKKEWNGELLDYLLFNAGNCFKRIEDIHKARAIKLIDKMKEDYRNAIKAQF